jgi:hypothetical protein
MSRLPLETMSHAMNNSAPGHSAVTRRVGAWDWRCSSTAASWPGRGPGRPASPRQPGQPRLSRRRSATISLARSRAWRWRVSRGADQ